MKHVFSNVSSVSLKADAWSSRFYEGYMCVTINWIDVDWYLKIILLDFKRFHTPHTSDATCMILKDFMEYWGIIYKKESTATYNDSDMISGISKPHGRLKGVS